ncbi:MAG: molecular chaperone TorD family protein [Firmicutes bacterium]|nr:molecular chaperone TorD family protein [Bacillota bacterium]
MNSLAEKPLSGFRAPEEAARRGILYVDLAACWAYPSAALLDGLRGVHLGRMRQLAVERGFVKELESLEEALQEALARPLEDWCVEHTRLFGGFPATGCQAYETAYTASHVFQQTQEMADVAGFYRAFGVAVGEGTERVDHLVSELEFMGFLAMKESQALDKGEAEQAAVCRDAQQSFLASHLGRWVGPFSGQIGRKTLFPFYCSLSRLTSAYVDYEMAALGVVPEPVNPPQSEDAWGSPGPSFESRPAVEGFDQ